MRLKFYRMQNQPAKLLGELQKIFNVKDSSNQDRISYFLDSNPFSL